jgi:hypothetical protein
VAEPSVASTSLAVKSVLGALVATQRTARIGPVTSTSAESGPVE